MKITIYTVTDCQFSKQEKDYLASHNLQYEEKNLETNKDWLTEMLAVSNNFAGTPVTKIEKDDGTIAVLKGFTKEDFDKTLGFTEEAKPAEPNKPEEPTAEAQPTPTSTPPQPIPTDSKLNTVLDKLEEKTAPPAETPPPAQTPTPTIPSTPPSADEASAKAAPANPPTIPDFSSDVKITA